MVKKTIDSDYRVCAYCGFQKWLRNMLYLGGKWYCNASCHNLHRGGRV